MKTLVKVMLGVLIALFSISLDAQAQSFTRNGNTFVSTSTRKSDASTAEKTKYTWADNKGKEYSIFITKSGRCFVNKVSGKTGKEYKYYLDEELSKTICKELGVTYTPKKTKTPSKSI